MSASSESAGRQLIADSGVPACEVIVLDGRFTPVAHGIGKVEVMLQPGLYKVRYKIGRTVTDSGVIELEPGSEPFVVPIPRLTVRTARPTRGDRPSEAGQPDIASRLSKHVDKHVGSGAEIFLFVRDGTDSSDNPVPTGLTLFDHQGVQVADLADAHGEKQCAGCTLALNPGSYFLRLRQSDGPPLEQCIHLSEGWQTQVFLESQRPDPASPVDIDLSDAAILMSPLGHGFNPDDNALLWTDSARQALASARNSAPLARLKTVQRRYHEMQRSGMPLADIARELRSEFPNAMHGIHSAHLLAQSPDYDVPLLRDVIDILRLQVGDHPDVTALWLTDPNTPLEFRTPPMLRSSWQLIVRSTADRHDVVPKGSYASTIGNRLWGGGAWLVWRAPEISMAAADALVQEAPLELLLAYVQTQLETKSPEEFLAGIQVSPQRFTSMELTVLSYVARLMSQLDAARAFTAKLDQRLWYGSALQTVRKLAPETFASSVQKATQSMITRTLNVTGMVAQTGMPYFTVTDAARNLVEKLNIKADPKMRAHFATGVASFTTTVSNAVADVSARARNLLNK
jgi:hypothetical protein